MWLRKSKSLTASAFPRRKYRGHQKWRWSLWFIRVVELIFYVTFSRDYHRVDPNHRQYGLSDRSAQGTLLDSAGLVHHNVLWVRGGNIAGIRRSSLFHKTGQRRGSACASRERPLRGGRVGGRLCSGKVHVFIEAGTFM